MKFEKWLGELLGQDEVEICHLFRDQTALHFLIAWSLFESKCFSGFVRINQIEKFAKKLISEGFDSTLVQDATNHFHARYKDSNLYQQLMHDQACPRMEAIVRKNIQSLNPEESLFLVALVVYRFRNNIFHGNKKVQSWLQYKEQIRLCTCAMERFVTHTEFLCPSLPER